MPSLKSLKLRIKSVKSTQKITKAMKMVAAAKLKRSKEQVEATAPYADKMANVVGSLASSLDKTLGSKIALLRGNGKDKVHLLVVVTSDRGLCGMFNSSIIRFTNKKIQELEGEGKTVKLFIIGKKGYDFFKNTHKNKIIVHLDHIGRKGIDFKEAHLIAEQIVEFFELGKFNVCHVIYNKFKSAISQVVTNQQIIPLDNSFESTRCIVGEPYEYEPSKEEILENLLLKNLVVQVFRALIESNASENGARMTAMDNATRNSGEMIKKLNLLYNRTRQAYITKELIEIISGADAV
jgi:F-type H+-transporting ATPase subunit gamma